MNKDSIVARSEIYRLTKAITAEEQSINAIYQRIGQTYFTAHQQEPEQAQAADVRAVLEAMDRIKGYREQINVHRGITICPGCQSEVSVTAAFCSRCGTRLQAQPPAQPAAPDSVQCPKCGNRCDARNRFCMHCGALLPEAAQQQPAAPAPQPAAPVFAQQVPQGSPMTPPPVPQGSFAPSVPAEIPVPQQTVQGAAPAAPIQMELPVTTPPETAEPVPETPPMESAWKPVPEMPVPEPVPAPIPEPVPELAAEAPVPVPEAPAKRRCPNCGTELEAQYRFCLECGCRL